MLLRGTKEDPFTKLQVDFHNLVKRNPNKVTNIKTDDNDWFEFL